MHGEQIQYIPYIMLDTLLSPFVNRLGKNITNYVIMINATCVLEVKNWN
jgi:hypothetical protein